MRNRSMLSCWIVEALKFYGGSASIVKICEYIWSNYELSLRESGELFYTWQYDIRWEATRLRKQGVIKSANQSLQGIWDLAV